MRFHRIVVCSIVPMLAVFILVMSSATAGAADVMATAKQVATNEFAGCTYGDHEKDSTKVNCVQFLIAVVEKLAKDESRTMIDAIRSQIAISNVKADEDLQKLVDDNDDRTKGVQWALTQAGWGQAVEPANAQVGDLVQYWYKDGGKWYGHSGIISKIEGHKATIYGAHNSTLQSERSLPRDQRQGGIGDGPIFDLTAIVRKVYVVRWLSAN